MSAASVTIVGYVASDGFERKGESDKAPFKARIGVGNAVQKLDKSRGSLYKNLVVWPNTPAGEMLTRLANAGKEIKKGSSLIITGVLNGEEYVPKGAEEGSRPVVAEWITVNQIFFNNVGSGTKSDSAPKTETAAPAQAANGPIGEDIPLPGGAPVLDL